MPVSSESYGDEIVFPFVENLFPEGEVRRLIMKSNKIPEANFEKFLSLMVNDVAGALSIQAEGCKPDFELPINPVIYGVEELSQILLDIQDRPFFVGAGSKAGNRMCLAGAQHKLLVLMIDGKICDSKGSPTTHLIKPSPKKKTGEKIRLPSLVYNEFVCMRAAKAAQISTANVTLLDVYDQDGNESDALLIERYDRIVGKSVKRL